MAIIESGLYQLYCRKFSQLINYYSSVFQEYVHIHPYTHLSIGIIIIIIIIVIIIFIIIIIYSRDQNFKCKQKRSFRKVWSIFILLLLH